MRPGFAAVLGLHVVSRGGVRRGKKLARRRDDHVRSRRIHRPGAGRRPGNQSVAELIKQVSEESSRLLRGELKLAQAEMTQKAKTAGDWHRGLRGGRRAGLVRTGLFPGHRYFGVGSGAAGLAWPR